MKRGNCIAWAILQKIRYGGFLQTYLSPNYWFVPSVIWSADGKIWYKYVDHNRVNKPSFWQNLFPIHTFYFVGDIVRVKPHRKHNQ